MTAHKSRTAVTLDLALLSLTFCIAVLLIGPSGDFALNDDWSFAIAARRLFGEHQWHPNGWASMSLISHAAWGAGFCTLVGSCTATVLRASTLVLSLVGIAFSYLLARELSFDRSSSLVAAGVAGANPLFLGLSMTFMTDVSFFTFSVLACFAATRFLKTGGALALVALTVFTLAATLCRQVGLFAGVAVAVAVWTAPFSLRVKILAVIPLIVSVVALITFNKWMDVLGVTPALYALQSSIFFSSLIHPKFVATHLFFGAIDTLLYVGCFSLPFLIATSSLRPTIGSMPRRVGGWLAILLVIGAATAMWERGTYMPTIGNMLRPEGLGPFPPNVRSTTAATPISPLPSSLWLFATIIGLLGGSALVTRLAYAAACHGKALLCGQSDEQSTLSLFFLVAIASYLGPMLLVFYFDRYFLLPMLLLPLAISTSTLGQRLTRHRAAWMLMGVLAIWSVSMVHDYMEWNDARWRGITALERRGVQPRFINAGFEYAGLHDYSPRQSFDPITGGWGRKDDRYAVNFSSHPDYRIVGRIPYRTWLPVQDRTALILQRRMKRN